MRTDSNTVAAITGASSGIGAALAVKLGSAGARVGVNGRRESELEAVAERISEVGGKPFVFAGDISDWDVAAGFIDATRDQFGTIDIVVNNAGSGDLGRVENTPRERIEALFALNVFPLWATTSRALPTMKANGSGHIINVASLAGVMGVPLNSVYVATKHAVVGFTAALRAELIGTGIDATVVCPVNVSTEWGVRTAGGSIGQVYYDAIVATGQGDNPMFEMFTPEAVADAIEDTITNAGVSDLYTHPGTADVVAAVAADRREVENQMAPFFAAMLDAYANMQEQA